MEKKAKRTNRKQLRNYMIVALIIIVVIAILGTGLVISVRSSVRKMNNVRMLDIVMTAADMLDGDILRDLKKEDAGTPEYQSQIDILTYFQNNIELDYIYCIRPTPDGNFVFSIDSTVDDPGEFGSEIIKTAALVAASKGTPSVDSAPYTDDWGTFYSAYCPVYDSNGAITTIVAVDLAATTYEKPIWTITIIVMGIILLALVSGGLLVFIMTMRLRRRLSDLEDNLSSLGDNIEDLNTQINAGSNHAAPTHEKEPDYVQMDDIGKLNAKIDVMQTNLEKYMERAHKLAYTDSMTGVNNKSAYFEKTHALDRNIKNGTANFAVAVFDINDLKKMNDNYGHEHGDRVIVDSVKIISEVFGINKVYRIGGDEFIVIAEGATLDKMERLFAAADARLEKFNTEEKTYPTTIGFAKGAAAYSPEIDKDYKSVFKRADENMFRDKETYHVGRCSLNKN